MPIAQAQTETDRALYAPIYTVSPNQIKSQGITYTLWGTFIPDTITPALFQSGIESLSDLIGDNNLSCTLYSGNIAQCRNSDGSDLSEVMLQNGYAITDRASVASTNKQSTYLNAESHAQSRQQGLWYVDNRVDTSFNLLYQQMTVIIAILVILAMVVVAAIVAGILRLKNNLDRIYISLTQSNKLYNNDAQIRKKEQDLAAIMIHAELKSNHSKTEAFLIIYEDLLETLQDPTADHKYMRAGEIVRSAPALDRYIYDANLQNLGALGDDLAPRVIDFYNKIETDPAYTNLEQDMSHEAAVTTVQNVVHRAQRLKEEIEYLSESFDEKGFKSVNLALSN